MYAGDDPRLGAGAPRSVHDMTWSQIHCLALIEQFNRGKFFEQHETLEDLWREEQRPLRRLYQGILQIGVAMYHIQRRNHHGAVYMLTRGSGYLRPFAPSCQGVDVEDLLASARRLLELVERLGPNRLDEFDWNDAPQVRWIG